MLPEVTGEYLNSKIKVIGKHLLVSNVEYNFDGIDDQDPKDNDATPFELIVNKNLKDLISHKLIRKLLTWKWKVFGAKYFYRQASLSLLMLALFSYCCISVIEQQSMWYPEMFLSIQ